MRAILPIIFILLAVGIRILIRLNNARELNDEIDSPLDDPERNRYFEARSRTLACSPAHLGLREIGENEVYAVVLETNVDYRREMLLATVTGEVELYEFPKLITASGADKPAQPQAVAFVKAASQYIEFANQSREVSSPIVGQIKFFLLTRKGTFVAKYLAYGPDTLRESFQPLLDMANGLKSVLKLEAPVKEE